MGGSVQPEQDPLEQLKAMKAAQAADPLAQLVAMKQGQKPVVNDGNPLHAEYAKGLLAGRMQRENENEQEATANDHLNPLQRGLAAIANTAGGIPGVEPLQAAAAALVNRIPYSQAYHDIRGAEGEIAAPASFINRAAGAGIVAPLLPGGVGTQGALFGAASGLLNADPNAGVEHRILSGAGQAALGAGVGKLLEGATTLGRSLFAKPPGTQALAIKDAMSAADKAKYGAAAAEGQQAVEAERAMLADVRQRMANVRNAGNQLALPAPGQSEVAKAVLDARPLRGPGGRFATPPDLPPTLEEAAAHDYTNVLPEPTPAIPQPAVYDYTNPRPLVLRAANDVNVRLPESVPPPAPLPEPPTPPLRTLRDALESPGIRDYTQAVLSSPRFANADAPTVAAEIYRQMSADQRMLTNRAFADANNFKPAAGLKAGDIADAKQQLLNAMDGVAPSFRAAVEGHAAMAGVRDAAQTASDIGRRVMTGTEMPFKKMAQDSPEALMRKIAGMNQEQAQAAKDALLARLKQRAANSLTWKPWYGFGLPRELQSAIRISPYINQASAQAGGSGINTGLQSLLAAMPSTLIHKP